jgi:hypothetical protein
LLTNLYNWFVLLFDVADCCVLQYFRCKSGFKTPKFVFSKYQLNTLTTEGSLLIAFSFGFFFDGILLVIVTELIGPLPTIPRVLFFVSLLIIGTIIADTLRKALQNTKMAF